MRSVFAGWPHLGEGAAAVQDEQRCAGVPAQNAQPAQVRAAVGRFCVFVVSVLNRAFLE
jgi:hypothetical protein